MSEKHKFVFIQPASDWKSFELVSILEDATVIAQATIEPYTTPTPELLVQELLEKHITETVHTSVMMPHIKIISDVIIAGLKAKYPTLHVIVEPWFRDDKILLPIEDSKRAGWVQSRVDALPIMRSWLAAYRTSVPTHLNNVNA